MKTLDEKEEERKIIKFVTKILLYLLLAMAFFSFKELGDLGARNVTLYLFFSAMIALIILSFMFVIGKKDYRIGYIFTIPFILYFWSIPMYLLFENILGKGNLGGISNFFNDLIDVIFVLVQSEQIIIVIGVVVFIEIICLAYLMGKNKEKGNAKD